MPLVNNLGAWGATQTGLRYANRNAYKLALTMGADGRHFPESIPGFLIQHSKRELDVSVGAYPERESVVRQLA